ncbi:MAG TPA: tetratricopeptide repeat protein, partial [Polyangia bacterium]|nr:tetratricopeptide repeat protein [Polyangia bacterium]
MSPPKDSGKTSGKASGKSSGGLASPLAPAPGETSSHGREMVTAPGPVVARPGDERFVEHLAAAGELVAGGRFREAEVEVLRALSGLPADLRALNLLALVRFKLGRLEEARATYREIAGAAPNDASARRNLGLLAIKLDNLDEAIPELEMAARLVPGDKQAWSYLGYAYAKKGQTVPAAAAFRRAGQDALAEELEHAATARRPTSNPKLSSLASSGGTPPPAAAPAGIEGGARGGTPAPAPLVLPPPGETSSHGSEMVTAPGPVAARPGDERFVDHLAAAGDHVAGGRV